MWSFNTILNEQQNDGCRCHACPALNAHSLYVHVLVCACLCVLFCLCLWLYPGWAFPNLLTHAIFIQAVNVNARLNMRTCKSFLNVQQLLHVPAHSHKLMLPTFYSRCKYFS